MMSLHKLKTGHWPVFLISLLSALTNLFLPIVLVRLISPNDIGIYKLFFLYAQGIISISLAGGPLYSVYYWVGKKSDSARYIEQAWILSFLLSAGAALLGLAFSEKISQMISINESQTILLLISAITAAPASFYGEYLIAKGNRVSGSLFNSGFEIIKAFVIIGLVFIKRDIHMAFWGYTILFFIKFVLAYIFAEREKLITFKIDKEKMKEVWRYCAPISTAGALSFCLEKIDMILLSSKLDPINFAFYSMGCLVVPPLLLLEMSVQKVLVPELSRAFHHDDLKSMVQSYRKAQNDIAYLMIPAVFGLIIFNRPIIEILFTSQYMESAAYLKLYAFTYLTYIIPHDSIPRATGKTGWVLKMYLILTPLSIVVVYFYTGLYGAKGALVSSMLFMFLPKIPGLLYSAGITKTNIMKLIAWRAIFFYTVINFILMFVCFELQSLFKSERSWFLVLGPLYALVYVAIVTVVKKMKERRELGQSL